MDPGSTTGTTPTPEPSSSPSAGPGGRDIGLAFRLCHLQPLGGIDFFGDGTNGKAWTGTKILEDGTVTDAYDDRYGVAVDYTGDGVADSWSGVTHGVLWWLRTLEGDQISTVTDARN